MGRGFRSASEPCEKTPGAEIGYYIASMQALTEPAQNGHVHQTLLRGDAAVPREQMSEEQHVQLRLMIAQQDRRPQFLPCLALQQALRVLDLKPYAGKQQHGPLEGARGRPLSQPTVADDVQACGGDGAVGCAEEKGGEGGGAAGVEVDLGHFGEVCDDVEDLRGEEDGDWGADENVGEDGGETHGVECGAGLHWGLRFRDVAAQWEIVGIADWPGEGKDSSWNECATWAS